MLKIIILILVVTSTYFHDVTSACVNKTALSAIDVWVHKNAKENAIIIEETSINLLDSYRMVDVVKANVTELCEGMIKNLPILETLSLININLSTIQPNVFNKIPRLRHLSLSANNLKEIKKGIFNTIPYLTKLYLSSNIIESIEEDAFASMPYLKAVHLDRNRITTLNGNIFRGCPRINLIDFNSNNIEEISGNAFEDIRPNSLRSIDIRLINNNIREVAPEAFDMLPPVNLHLERNRITKLSILFSSLKQHSRLYLNYNRITCIPDDVLETMRNTTIHLYLLNNPIECGCLERVENVIGEEVYGIGRIYYNSTFRCGADMFM